MPNDRKPTPEERAEALAEKLGPFQAVPDAIALEHIAAAIREAVAEERERCARVAESWRYVPDAPVTGQAIAVDIRNLPARQEASSEPEGVA